LTSSGPSPHAEILALLAEVLDLPEHRLAPESHLVEDLGASSLHIAELVLALEIQFGFEIPTREVESLRTIDDVLRCVRLA
jgi:acyl carrier protein